jgi:hypothetical protein
MEQIMSFAVKLIIGAWLTTLVMIGFCALNESGRLLKIRKLIALWLEASASAVHPPEEDLRPEGENVA